MERRGDLLKALLVGKGLNPERIKIAFVSYLEGEKFKNDVEKFIEEVSAIK